MPNTKKRSIPPSSELNARSSKKMGKITAATTEDKISAQGKDGHKYPMADFISMLENYQQINYDNIKLKTFFELQTNESLQFSTKKSPEELLEKFIAYLSKRNTKGNKADYANAIQLWSEVYYSLEVPLSQPLSSEIWLKIFNTAKEFAEFLFENIHFKKKQVINQETWENIFNSSTDQTLKSILSTLSLTKTQWWKISDLAPRKIHLLLNNVETCLTVFEAAINSSRHTEIQKVLWKHHPSLSEYYIKKYNADPNSKIQWFEQILRKHMLQSIFSDLWKNATLGLRDHYLTSLKSEKEITSFFNKAIVSRQPVMCRDLFKQYHNLLLEKYIKKEIGPIMKQLKSMESAKLWSILFDVIENKLETLTSKRSNDFIKLLLKHINNKILNEKPSLFKKIVHYLKKAIGDQFLCKNYKLTKKILFLKLSVNNDEIHTEEPLHNHDQNFTAQSVSLTKEIPESCENNNLNEDHFNEPLFTNEILDALIFDEFESNFTTEERLFENISPCPNNDLASLPDKNSNNHDNTQNDVPQNASTDDEEDNVIFDDFAAEYVVPCSQDPSQFNQPQEISTSGHYTNGKNHTFFSSNATQKITTSPPSSTLNRHS